MSAGRPSTSNKSTKLPLQYETKPNKLITFFANAKFLIHCLNDFIDRLARSVFNFNSEHLKSALHSNQRDSLLFRRTPLRPIASTQTIHRLLNEIKIKFLLSANEVEHDPLDVLNCVALKSKVCTLLCTRQNRQNRQKKKATNEQTK